MHQDSVWVLLLRLLAVEGVDQPGAQRILLAYRCCALQEDRHSGKVMPIFQPADDLAANQPLQRTRNLMQVLRRTGGETVFVVVILVASGKRVVRAGSILQVARYALPPDGWLGENRRGAGREQRMITAAVIVVGHQ